MNIIKNSEGVLRVLTCIDVKYFRGMLLIEKSKLENILASEGDHGRFQQHRGAEVSPPH